MDRWDPISLTSAFRPVLESDESVQCTQDQIGLYDGRQKAEDYTNGTVYLTCYRLLYIDAKDPARKSIGLHLRYIRGIQHFGGFMSSSPKLTLDLYPRSFSEQPESSSDLLISSTSSSSGGPELSSAVRSTSITTTATAIHLQPWVCSICYNNNQPTLFKCAVCGVVKPANTARETPSTLPTTYPFLLDDTESASPVSPQSKSRQEEGLGDSLREQANNSTNNAVVGALMGQAKIACPACTFHNDPFMIQCEICGSDLQDQASIQFALERQQDHQRSIRNLPTRSATSGTMSGTTTTTTTSTSSESGSTGGAGMLYSFTNMVYSRTAAVARIRKTSESDSTTGTTGGSADSIKLSFRNGGATNFLQGLRSALANKAWESKPSQSIVLPKNRDVHSLTTTFSSATISSSSPSSSSPRGAGTLLNESMPGHMSAAKELPIAPTVGGISGIMRTVETQQKVTDRALTDAFQDLEGLMKNAQEMVTLAETISNRLAKNNNAEGGGLSEETATFKTYLLSMGIAAPVTKDTAGAVFHKELARELAEFLQSIVEREHGMMSLTDVYCVFNRARGVALISPKDLHTACLHFEELGLNLRLRKFESGLLVIQTLSRYSDEETSETILKHVRQLATANGGQSTFSIGVSAIELASVMQMSVALVMNHLIMTEAKGLLCRDESIEGVRFYDNLFARLDMEA